MIPKHLREQIADELEMLAHEWRHAKVEADEAHAALRLDSVNVRVDDLMAEHSADILAQQYQEDIVQSRKIYDLAAHRASRFMGRVRHLSERFGLRLDT